MSLWSSVGCCNLVILKVYISNMHGSTKRYKLNTISIQSYMLIRAASSIASTSSQPTMSSSSSTPAAMNLMPVSEKLVRGNHTLWKAQVLAVLCGAQLARFIEGTNATPPEKIKVKAQKGEDLEEVTNPAFELLKA
jgi:hypothetical protein